MADPATAKLKAPMFDLTVKTKRINGTYGGMVGTSEKTMASVMRNAFLYAAYYLREREGHEEVRVEINESCSACLGSGFESRTVGRSAKCKTCKGYPHRAPHIVFDLTRRDLHDAGLTVLNLYESKVLSHG